MNITEDANRDLQQDVTNELKWDPSLSSEDISVTADNGVITLRGNVPHFYEKSTALEAAQRVDGVRAVADEIEVKLMGSYERTDGDIAQAALNAFEWSYSIPHNLKVTVEKGWVTLKGEVDWDFERVAAKDAVSQLMGVRGVSSELSIKETVKATDVKNRIDEALSRSALNEGNKIKIGVDGGRVTLSGNVNSFSEMGDAALAAWFAPGVTRVDNNLQVTH